MKTIVLIRHAQSSWSIPYGKDADRELTTKGADDAEKMAAALYDHGIIPDKIYSSPAVRALQTAKIFAEGVNVKDHQICIEGALYEPTVQGLYKAVESVPDDIRSIFLFSHNSGLTEFIRDLDITLFSDMPACGVFAFELMSEKWKELRIAEKRFLFFKYP